MRSRYNPRRDDGLTKLLYFAAGLSLGTVLGFLIAPELRKSVGARSEAACDSDARDYLGYGRHLYEKGRELADEAAGLYEAGRHLVEG